MYLGDNVSEINKRKNDFHMELGSLEQRLIEWRKEKKYCKNVEFESGLRS